MTIRDIFFGDPIRVVAIPVTRARLCPGCNLIVEDHACPLCARGTDPMMGVSMKREEYRFGKQRDIGVEA